MFRVEFRLGYDGDKGRPVITYVAHYRDRVIGPVFSIVGLIRRCRPQDKKDILEFCENKLAGMSPDDEYRAKLERAIARAKQA